MDKRGKKTKSKYVCSHKRKTSGNFGTMQSTISLSVRLVELDGLFGCAFKLGTNCLLLPSEVMRQLVGGRVVRSELMELKLLSILIIDSRLNLFYFIYLNVWLKSLQNHF